jgi:hypothetical protein
LYDPIEEYARIGVATWNDHWRLSDVNRAFDLCPTYPRLFAVPAKISDSVLFHAAKFRSRGRLPVLSYLHAASAGASITRSSQPLVGLKSKRSIQDEKLIEAIFDSLTQSSAVEGQNVVGTLPLQQHVSSFFTATSSSAVAQSAGQLAKSILSGANSSSAFIDDNSNPTPNVIIDARPLSNAMANRAMGAGTESLENYRRCQRLFMGIDNIHVMRDSLGKLGDAVDASTSDVSMEKWLSALDSAQWLKHIRNIGEATALILRTMTVDRGHVLIHCSDGWDRTAQLSALTQLCLDPYYRTLRGFMVLVEKEWVGFGHKFNDRCGFLAVHPPKISAAGGVASAMSQAFGANTNNQSDSSAARSSKEEKETAPVFLQFLECTWLLLQSYPHRFEFNQRFLVDLFSALQSCQFGTFLMNCERERNEKRIRQRCQSYWSHCLQVQADYMNPLYQSSNEMLHMPTHASHYQYWLRLYSRFDPPALMSAAMRTTDTEPWSAQWNIMEDRVHASAAIYPFSHASGLEDYMQQLRDVRDALRLLRNTPTTTCTSDGKHVVLNGKITLDAKTCVASYASSCQRCRQFFKPLDKQVLCWYCGRCMCQSCTLYALPSGLRCCLACYEQTKQ